MEKDKKERVSYDYNYLKGFCSKNELTLLKDYSNDTIIRETFIEIKCMGENCENVCNKKLVNLVVNKNFGCIDCTPKLKLLKTKNTCIKKYGVDSSSKIREVKDKRKQTMIDKYGCEHALQSNIFKNKYKQTCLEKYGTESHTKNNSVKEKIKQSNINKYGVENVMHSTEVMEKSSKNAYKLKDYILPSGKIIKTQGYESYAIDYLIKNDNALENDIITCPKNVPTIWYNDENDKKHRHYVDIFIPSQNKCIEVKSTWTAEKKKDCIFLKQKTAKDLGYNYEIWIFNKKGDRIETII